MLLSFASDFGPGPYPGICKGVIARLAPEVPVLDLTHDLPPFDVRGAALVLEEALPYLPVGVHLAVVDPGVGTARRAVVIRVGRGDLLVGPDNGLWSRAWRVLGGVRQAWHLAQPPWRLEPVSDTFQARDLMAPAAARLAAGDPVSWAGPEVPPSTLVRLRLPGVRRTEAGLVLSVLAVDPFGAVHLSARGWAGLAPGAWVRLRLPGRSRPVRARCTRTYAEVAVGEPCLLVDSSGWLTLAVNRGDARSRFHLHPGMRLTLQREAEGKAPP